jgi:hypothetical protein
MKKKYDPMVFEHIDGFAINGARCASIDPFTAKRNSFRFAVQSSILTKHYTKKIRR